MATQFGNLQEFRPESDSIKSYLERATLYFSANYVPDDKQVAILLSTIGSQTYSLLSDLLAPDSPGSKSLADISGTLCRHFEPKCAIIVERFYFHKRDQAAKESIKDFDAALQKLATHCNFGANLEEALRDRFVCGLRHEMIQRQLLSETDLSYHKAMDIALSIEAADKNTRAFRPPDAAIHSVPSHVAHIQARRPCYRCGRLTHDPVDCQFRDSECHYCHKKGHIAPVCRAKAQAQQRRPQPASGRTETHRGRRTNRVQEDEPVGDTGDSSGDEYRLHKLNSRSSCPIEVDVSVNGTKLTMEVDTGAAVSIISETTRRVLLPTLPLRKSDLVLKTYTDERMLVVATLNVKVQYGDQLD